MPTGVYERVVKVCSYCNEGGSEYSYEVSTEGSWMTPGQIAFEAFIEERKHHPDALIAPFRWQDVNQDMRSAWEAAAKAVWQSNLTDGEL